MGGFKNMNPGELFSVDMVTKERLNELTKETVRRTTQHNISLVQIIVQSEDAFADNPYRILGIYNGLKVILFAIFHPIRVHRMVVNRTKENICTHINEVFKEYI
jgi:hypothetical protein